VKIILEFSLPCVVAVTKADTHPDPESRKAAISQQLLEAGLVTEEFGGDAPVCLRCGASPVVLGTNPMSLGPGCGYFCKVGIWHARIQGSAVAPSGGGLPVVFAHRMRVTLANVCILRFRCWSQKQHFRSLEKPLLWNQRL
jgi:hypothetical protein